MNKWLKTTFISLATLALLLNLCFYSIAMALGVARPVIMVEYFLVVLLAIRLKRPNRISLFIIMMFCDLLLLASQWYVIFDVTDLFFLITFIQFSSIVYTLILVGLFVFVVLVALVVFKCRPELPEHHSVALVLFLLLCGIDMNLHHPDDEVTYRRGPSGFSASLLQTIYSMRFASGILNESTDPVRADQLVSKSGLLSSLKLLDVNNQNIEKKYFVVMVESFGVFNSDAVNESLYGFFEKSVEFSRVVKGEQRYLGNTLNAEFRELCDVYSVTLRPPSNTAVYQGCLPKMISSRGGTAVSIHAAHSGMYDREEIYHDMGFTRSFFWNDGHWKSRCYSFPGACDLEVLDWLFSNKTSLFQNDLVYWLTLNSHHPYDSRDVVTDVDSKLPEYHSWPDELKTYYDLQYQFLSGLADFLNNDALAGFDVLIVGDHEPKFTDRNINRTFFKSDLISYIYLER